MEQRVERVSHGRLTWVNVQNPSPQEMDVVAGLYGFDHLVVEDCLTKVRLQKIDEYKDYVFAVLHFPCVHEDNSGFASSQLSIFIGKNYLVTVHDEALRPVATLFERCKADEGQRKRLMSRSPEFLLYRVLDVLVDEIFPLLGKLLEELDDVEELVFSPKVDVVCEVSAIRRQISDLRRIIIHLRHGINELPQKAQKFSRQDLSAFFGDVMDHVERISEALEEAKETIEIYKDTDFMLSTEKTSKILAVLTIVFTLSIPATIIGTFYGMNIHLPGGIATEPWTFLGPYTTLIVLAIVSMVPAALMIWSFRRLGWV